MGSPNVFVPLSAAAFREVDIIGVFRYANTYKAALELMGSGALKGMEKLITQRYRLEDCQEAFEALANGSDESGNMVIKAMIKAAEPSRM
jgi:L-iditol 2-dehydrogenase